MRLFNTGDGEGGEELGVWDPGVPLCHDAAQAGHGPVPGTRGVSGPGEAWLWMWPDPALHRDTSADIGCNLLVTQGVNHNWRMLNPKWQSYKASLKSLPNTPESDTARVISSRVCEDAGVSTHIIRHNLSSDSPGRSPGIDTLILRVELWLG